MKFDVGIIGLGYVGLTLATALAKIGYTVAGIEKRAEIVDLTNQGIPHFKENGLEEQLGTVVSSGRLKAYSELQSSIRCDIYIITVGTPLSGHGEPRLDMIRAAASEVASNMQNNSAVILRSTVMVGTTRNIVKPILDATGLNYELSMCPERTLEGNAMNELFTLPQIIGSEQYGLSHKARAMFGKLTKSIVEVNTFETAEIIKLVDNTSRDISFAFANEVTRICEAYSVNAMEVINSGKLGYPRTNVALPGLVGGPCLEKDPHIFNFSAQNMNLDLEITKAARLVNERQPKETIELIYREAKKRDFSSSIKITVLGMAFKGIPETNDLRGSMSFKILQHAMQLFMKANFVVFDFVATRSELEVCDQSYSVEENLQNAVRGASIVIIANNHKNFAMMNLSEIIQLMDSDGFIYDYWNHFPASEVMISKSKYYSLGNVRGLGN